MSFEDYLRKWLDDPTSIVNSPTPKQPDVIVPDDTNLAYYEKYLNNTKS